MTKKNRKKMKQERLRNKKILKKYGNWIGLHSDWSGELIEDYTEYNAFTGGWGMLWHMLINDLNPLIHKYNLQNKFYFEQIKEKYGEIRAYHNGAPKEIDDLINAYSFISNNVCQWCGRPDSAISKGYWVQCQCKQCFDKYWKNKTNEHLSYEERYDTNPEHCRIPDVRKVTRFSKNGNETIEYDIKDIVDRYRNKWYNKHKEVAMDETN